MSGRKESGREAPTLTKELFTSKYRSLAENAQALKREMKRRGIEEDNLDGTIAKIEDLAQAYDDKAKAQRLESSIVEDLKALEFTLRRQIEKESLRPALGGNADVPAEFKPLVAEYYRSLADRP
jgi:hypothetical protein